MSDTRSAYDRDFYAWATEQAQLLRAGRLEDADIDNIAEEIQSLARGERRELVSRLEVLLVDLLKWRFQPSHRDTNWRLTIREQRRKIARHLQENPSLAATLGAAIEDAYGDSLFAAQRETGLSEDTFPATCPYAASEILSDSFLPP
jgi:ribosomal protein L29